MKSVECFFDVGSPYSYLAFHQLPKIAKARNAEVVWRPMLLGAVLKATGNSSPVAVPTKGLYSMIDLDRWAAYYGVTFQINPYFPINTLTLMRGATGMQMLGAAQFHSYLAAIFSAMFEHPRNLNVQTELAAVLESTGIAPAKFLELINAPAVKDRLRETTDEAISRGVFGAPTMFVNSNMYWGQDRLFFVDRELAASPHSA
jgi:2-hydroxychromene-2-carboxylate isomerase